MIFQDHHLLMDRTVYDNVAIPLIIAGASGDDIRRRVSAALDKVGLLDKAKNLPIQLSGGGTAARGHRPRGGEQTCGPAGG
ncbi:cell division transporter [Klebsiella michiganensis]|uniref:Cell division transporter n=1 Tax=Klebsiella michiganensis TaxID=1134687 RepID=A0A7H4PG84_9ENTR|nr:cell division transporter [Klebsiella michiganensis]